jgi:hypothetical protein
MTDDPINNAIAALNTFQPSDDDVDNQARLYEIFKNFRTLAGRDRAMPAMFALLERFPDTDSLGVPGPLVHEMEAILDPDGHHAHLSLLRDSVRRQPSYYTIWMMNRILNTELPREQRESWLLELRAAIEHPRSSEDIRRTVERYLDYQAGQSG